MSRVILIVGDESWPLSDDYHHYQTTALHLPDPLLSTTDTQANNAQSSRSLRTKQQAAHRPDVLWRDAQQLHFEKQIDGTWYHIVYSLPSGIQAQRNDKTGAYVLGADAQVSITVTEIIVPRKTHNVLEHSTELARLIAAADEHRKAMRKIVQ